MGLPRQEYWSGLLFPTPGDPPNLEIEPVSPALAGGPFTTEPPGKPTQVYIYTHSNNWYLRHVNTNCC